MIKDFTELEMSDLLFDKLSELGDEVILNKNPTTETIFPCRVIQNPLMYIQEAHETIAINKRFQITIENWSLTQHKCMDMINRTDEKLKELNILRTNSNSPIIYDEITKKYKMVGIYEVNYNALYNAFFSVKIRRN